MLVMALAAPRPSAVTAASTRTWTGNGTTNNWSDAGNWNTGVPVAGDSLLFPSVASRKANTNDLPLTLFASVTFTGGGYHIQGGGFDITSLENMPTSGSNVIDVAIGGAGTVTETSGKLTLSASNTYSLGTAINGGVLLITDDSALGSGAGAAFVADGATLQMSGGIDIGLQRVNLEGDGVDGMGALQSLSGTNRAGNVLLGGAVTIGVGNSILVISNGLQQAGPGAALTLVGGGKLQVDGSNSFNGPLSVEEGNLTWNSATPSGASVDHFGLLRGTGAVGGIAVTGGKVWPGSGSAPGILTSAGGVQFLGGVFRVDLDGAVPGSEYGQLAAGGLTLNPLATLLEVDLGFTPAVGQVFTIVNNAAGAVQGTFMGLPEGAVFGEGGYALQVSYKGGDGNDVTLKVLRLVAADLELTISASPSPVAAGDTLAYTISVRNDGPDTAVSPRISMGTPLGTTYQSAIVPDGWSCSMPSPGPSVVCTGSSIASGGSVTISLLFKVASSATGAITGTAGVISNTNDPFSADNSDTEVTPVGAGGGKPFRRVVMSVAKD
jgi:uncharacterized repeat protein (TIGR01451 family)